MTTVHPEFVSLSEICPIIKIQANYATTDNFTGVVVAGYKSQKIYLAKKTAEALCEVQNKLLESDYVLNIFDGYRPVKAVTFFQEWAKMPETDLKLKTLFYPRFSRLELFEQGYLAKKSSHSRGSAVDLTLYDLKNGKNLDMGCEFDFFDDISHTESLRITEDQRKNRMLLKNIMEAYGFFNFSKEWWHYTFRPEPFPETYFDFDVE